ncbi:viral A-type inclusion protein [Leptotrichia sp. oral taxon 847]|uniref:viral A-type inclusion protein n=1 Tax=Leptotrichia sp. oral taxon 847 TaxID=1785996 RepID=UPI0007684D84|nr:viral A-type inclusion protein [Leptotrichia sp. oral taxon 847]AMD95237.1 viral A-type inclusion protein [Leptotrichia sp. oral taxon 847]
MAKVVNPNSVSNMDLINQKAQAKMQQLVQKIGKGKRRVTVTFSKMSRGYVAKMIEEMKKAMAQYERQLPNLFSFFNYLEKEVRITKENKKEKTKDVKFSYEEIDFFKLQLNETIKGIDTQVATLKWYNLIKKGLFKTLKKQTETVLEEVKNGKTIKKK